MKIAIDLTPIESSPAGIGQYTINIASELAELASQHEIVGYSTKPLKLGKIHNVVIRPSRFPFARGSIWMYKAARDMRRNSIDLLISPSNQLFVLFFPKTLQVIHDLAPVYFKKYFSFLARIKYALTVKLSFKKALRIITVSETIKAELLKYSHNRLASENIWVIKPGLNKILHDTTGKELLVKEKYNLPSEYLLSVSTLEPRKNIVNMIKAFAELKNKGKYPQLKFVIVGKKGWYYESIFKTVAELKLTDEVRFTGYVEDAELSIIYKNAKAFVYLSVYEGFGIPPLEALYFNLPTLLSDIKVFKENYAELAVFCQHDNIKDIKEKLTLILNQSLAMRERVLEKFSWKQSAQKLLELINHVK